MLHEQPGVYEEFSLNGSDLYVASSEDYAHLLDEIEAYLKDVAISDKGELQSCQKYAPHEARAKQIQAELGDRYNDMADTHKEFALAVQGWTLEELRRREEERDSSQDATGVSGYSERITVLDELIKDFETEQEDGALIELARVLRQLTRAKHCVDLYRELFELTT